jgi:glyoxylase I family protein
MSFSPQGLTPLIGVFDMPRALAFYRDVLGFAVVSASPEVETAEGGCADVELAHQELAGRGLKAARPKVAPYGLKLFSAEDPDGYMIVFQEVR